METSDAIAALAALGQELRLRLWLLLVPYGSNGLPAGVIASRLDVAPSSLSFHLQQMTQAGVLAHRRSSRHIIYAVNGETTKALCAFLGSAGGQLIQLTIPPAVVMSAGETSGVLG